MTSLDRSATVAQIVTDHAAAARIFQRHQIDFCCHGHVTVAEACAPKGLDPDAVFAELEGILTSDAAGRGDDMRARSTAALVAYIVDRHHDYLRRALPYVAPLAAKVAQVHGARNAKLAGIEEAVGELTDALEPHLEQEETELFPALVSGAPDRALVRRELEQMYAEHVEVGALLARIRSLADGFTVPEWGCTTYRVLMTELEALEADLLRHVHLENHVLMPRFVHAGDEATA